MHYFFIHVSAIFPQSVTTSEYINFYVNIMMLSFLYILNVFV